VSGISLIGFIYRRQLKPRHSTDRALIALIARHYGSSSSSLYSNHVLRAVLPTFCLFLSSRHSFLSSVLYSASLCRALSGNALLAHSLSLVNRLSNIIPHRPNKLPAFYHYQWRQKFAISCKNVMKQERRSLQHALGFFCSHFPRTFFRRVFHSFFCSPNFKVNRPVLISCQLFYNIQ